MFVYGCAWINGIDGKIVVITKCINSLLSAVG